MKNIKKLLALALALVLAIGMVPVAGASGEGGLPKNAADYSDSDEIGDASLQAVDVLTAVQVFTGDRGALRPKDNVTRAEAAIIMARLTLGRTAADRLPSVPSSFRDVSSNHWALKEIAYCEQNGIIGGIGNNRFDPNGQVTAAQFAAMLLRALGYGQNGEYSGRGWDTNAIIDGMRLRILVGDVDFSAPAIRENIAQYAFNTVLADMVSYSSVFDHYFSGKEVGFAGFGPQTTLAESVFRLFMVPTLNDGLGYSQHVWKLNFATNPNNIAGPYRSDVTLFRSTSSANVTALVTQGNPFFSGYTLQPYIVGTSTSVPIEYYYNGINVSKDNTAYVVGDVSTPGSLATYTSFWSKAVYPATETSIIESLILADLNSAAGRRGVIVELIDRNFDGVPDKVVIIDKTVGRLSADPIVAASGTVTMLGVGTGTFPLAGGFPTVVYPTGLKSGDVVIYVRDAYGVTHVERAETLTGQMTRTNTIATIPHAFFDGVNRAASEIDNAAQFFDFAKFIGENTRYNTDLTAYLDDNGSILLMEGGETAPSVYGIVMATATTFGDGAFADTRVDLMKSDGTVGRYNVLKITPPSDTTYYARLNSAIVASGGLVSYVIDGDNVVLVPVETGGDLAADYAARSSVAIIDTAGNTVLTPDTVIIYGNAASFSSHPPAISKGHASANLGVASNTSVMYVTNARNRNVLDVIYFMGTTAPAAPMSNWGFRTVSSGKSGTRTIGNIVYNEYAVWVPGEDKAVEVYSLGDPFASGTGLYNYSVRTIDSWNIVENVAHITTDKGIVESVQPGEITYANATTRTITSATEYYEVLPGTGWEVVYRGAGYAMMPDNNNSDGHVFQVLAVRTAGAAATHVYFTKIAANQMTIGTLSSLFGSDTSLKASVASLTSSTGTSIKDLREQILQAIVAHSVTVRMDFNPANTPGVSAPFDAGTQHTIPVTSKMLSIRIQSATGSWTDDENAFASLVTDKWEIAVSILGNRHSLHPIIGDFDA